MSEVLKRNYTDHRKPCVLTTWDVVVFYLQTMELMKLGGDQTQTMTSKEIAELTGKNHSDVLRDIRNLQDQVKGESIFALSSYLSEQGKELPMYSLDKKQTLLLISGYNALLRLKIINRWEELEQNLTPKTYIEALKALVVSEEAKQKAIQQVENLNTVLDNLLEWVSILKVSKFNKVSEKHFDWRVLKKKSEDLGYTIKKAESPRYGYQNLYHITVFKACYPEYNYKMI
jgi:Rha family phage regulatory protein